MASLTFVGRNYVVRRICGDSINFACKDRVYFLTLILYLGEIAHIFLVLLSNCLNKAKTTKCLRGFNTLIKFIPAMNTLKQGKTWHIYFLILFSSCLYGTSMNILHYIQFTKTYEKNTALKVSEISIELRLLNLFFISLLSYLILSYQMYKHKVLGLVLVGLTVRLFIIMEMIDNDRVNVTILFWIIGINILYSDREVIHKYLMEFMLMSSVTLVFIEGCIGFVITLIILLSIQYPILDCRLKIFFNLNSGMIFLLFFLTCFAYDFSAIITKYYYEPTVMPVAYSLTVIVWKIINIFHTGVFFYQPGIFMSGALLSLFACLIYNKIIILYVCDFGRETKKEIMNRSDKECNVSELRYLLENMDMY